MSTAKEAILNRLRFSPKPLAVHELQIIGVSDNAAATRLSELARDGKVWSAFRKGENFKEWADHPFRPEHKGELL